MSELREQIQLTLNNLTQNIPIKWDRYTETSTGGVDFLNIYGWVPSQKHEADFLMVTFLIQNKKILDALYNTSSVKYSKICSKNWNCESHNDCKKWRDFP